MWPKRELEAGPIWREGSQCPFLANHQTFDVLVYFLCGSLAFQYMSGLFQADFMTNIEQTLNKVCDIKLEIYLMPLDAFGEAEDCGPAFWQLCIHPVNILIDKYPKITLKYTKYVSTENMWILRDPSSSLF